MTDLWYGQKPVKIVFQDDSVHLPEDVLALCEDVQELYDLNAIIPADIQDQVKTADPYEMSIRERMIITTPSPPEDNASEAIRKRQLQRELEDIQHILTKIDQCITRGKSEAACDTGVHAPLLRLALRPISGIEYQNITSARIFSEFIPRKATNTTLIQSKLIDYVINLVPNTELQEKINQFIIRQPSHLRLINQTMYIPIRDRPIVISIETKTPNPTSGQDPMVQLSIWIAAYHNRLASFRSIKRDIRIPTLPVLHVRGTEWYLSLACDQRNRIDLFPSIPIGRTDSILRIYQLLAVIRRLVQWAQTTFLDWFTDNVLCETS